MSVHPRVAHKMRETITALPLYYSGCLLKKCKKEKEFKKYFGELRGATLFLYEDNTQDTFTERLDLEDLISIELDSPFQKKTPTIFTLGLRTEEVQLKMDNPDTGEEWRGYILTVIKKEIPNKLQLLPGQILKLKEVLAQERIRNHLASHPPLPPRPSFLYSASISSPLPKDKSDNTEVPTCFFDVTREEAKQMLEENPEYGSMILRPSTLANNYALTIRQIMSSGPAIKNYRVSSTSSGFVIELESPVLVSSLQEVLDYFIKKTEYRLCPYASSEPYDTRIDVSQAPKSVNIVSTAFKNIPKAHVQPMLRSKTKEQPPPTPPKPINGEYVLMKPADHPDDQKLKLAKLGGELEEVLKLRRYDMYAAAGKEEVPFYENKSSKKLHTSLSS